MGWWLDYDACRRMACLMASAHCRTAAAFCFHFIEL
jgi:hypothetical protein